MAQRDNLDTVNLDYKVYLPFISVPLCEYKHPTAYVSVNKPVVKVGDSVTVTGALMNDCAIIEHPDYQLHANPETLIQPSHIVTNVFSQFIDYATYAPFTFTAQAVAAGEVTITVGSSFIEHDPGSPPGYPGWWSGASSRPVVVRILP